MDLGVAAGSAQEAHQQGSRRQAVDIVVADDADALRLHDRIGEPAGAAVDVAQRQHLRHRLAQGGVHVQPDAFQAHRAAGQDAAQDFRQIVAFGDRQRLAVVRQAGMPGAAADRALDIEEIARHLRLAQHAPCLANSIPGLQLTRAAGFPPTQA